MPDFSGIVASLSAGTIVSSVIAAGAIVAVVGFAMWSSRMVGQFYDDNKENEQGTSYVRCDECGERVADEDAVRTFHGDVYCDDCAESDRSDR